MKRFFVLFLIISLLFLWGCSKDTADILEFRQYPMSVAGTLLYKDNSYGITVNMSEPDVALITVDSPQTLCGYSFKVDNGGIWVYYDSMEIDISVTAELMPAGMLVDMLSVESAAHSYSRKEEDVRLDFFKTENAEIVLYSKEENDFPYLMEYHGEEDFSFELSSFAQ